VTERIESSRAQAESTRALEESRRRLEAIVTTAADGILVIDDKGIIEDANPAAERLFGHGRDDLIGRNVSLLMPEPYAGEHDGYLANYRRTGIRRILGVGRELVCRRRD